MGKFRDTFSVRVENTQRFALAELAARAGYTIVRDEWLVEWEGVCFWDDGQITNGVGWNIISYEEAVSYFKSPIAPIIPYGAKVWVSDESEEFAKKGNNEGYYLTTVTTADSNVWHIVCLDGDFPTSWKYVVPVEEEVVKEVTMAEVEEKFGCKIKVVAG